MRRIAMAVMAFQGLLIKEMEACADPKRELDRLDMVGVTAINIALIVLPLWYFFTHANG
jgi:hypothetical protein